MVMDKARSVLKEVFGYSSFRPMQEKAITAALKGKDSLVLMPTGGGKSICFQIPALVLDGITIVVSPLIALMKDQVEGLFVNGVKAAFLNSSLSQEQQADVLEQLKEEKLKLLYVSPEKMNSESFYYTLLQLKVSLFAIDEAHCISSWGHDFRPDYKRLGYLKKQFSQVPIMALTATADPLTQKDILLQLHLPEADVFKDSFSRSNIFIEARPAYKRKEAILNFIEQREEEPGIIYCLSKKNTEDLSRYLKENGVQAGYYHAGMDTIVRNRVQRDFINDRIRVVCATIAFGMGIDKSNVRWVIHHNLPKNIEGYYQEIGRSGRDGLPAHALLFYGGQDYKILSGFNEESDRKVILNARLDRMLHFAESNHCRRKLLLNYFGEYSSKDCGECDNCKGTQSLFEGTVLAQKALSAVARLHGKLTIGMLVHVLVGRRSPDILAGKFYEIKTFGAGQETSEEDWCLIINQLINLGYLKVLYEHGSLLALTPLSQEVLFEGAHVQLHALYQRVKRVEQPKVKKLSKVTIAAEVSLFERLRQLRRSMAVKLGVPPYILFSDATLSEMVTQQPINEWEMKNISGVGNKKWEQYGQAFVAEIIAFKNEKKFKSVPAFQKTLELYKQGFSPEVVASRMGINLITVYSHFAALYESGESVDIEQYVMSYELDSVKVSLSKPQVSTLADVYEDNHKEIPHHVIRIAMSILKKQK
jgi:ATP-dependent DNA helicase RecQ